MQKHSSFAHREMVLWRYPSEGEEGNADVER